MGCLRPLPPPPPLPPRPRILLFCPLIPTLFSSRANFMSWGTPAPPVRMPVAWADVPAIVPSNPLPRSPRTLRVSDLCAANSFTAHKLAPTRARRSGPTDERSQVRRKRSDIRQCVVRRLLKPGASPRERQVRPICFSECPMTRSTGRPENADQAHLCRTAS